MGNRMALLKEAIAHISQKIGPVVTVSSVYETPPWGYETSLAFYNLVAKITTPLSAQDVLLACLEIEHLLGRTRNNKGYSDRSMDIDVIFYNQEIYSDHNLLIPHPRFHLRNFVLEPLVEIAPNFIDPLSGKTVLELHQSSTDRGFPQKVGSLP